MIPSDRSLLVASMVLQSAVSLTLGLAFLGLWKGFHRPAANKWAVAWLVYSAGVVFSALGIGVDLGATLSPVGRALLNQPLLMAVVLFRAGADSLVAEGKPLGVARYARASVIVFVTILAVREVDASRIALHPDVARYIVPRLVMGALYAWAAWPLRRLARERWAEGYALMAGAMVCLSARMFVSAGYELWQIGHGAQARREILSLALAQLSFLIMFGVATALVLVEGERRAAIQAAQTIQETTDALRVSEARFRFVVEHTSDVQAVVGGDQRIRYVAPSCERLIGLPPSVFEGRGLVDFIHADDRDNVSQALARMAADPSGRRPPTPVRIQNRAGEWQPFDVTGQLVPQADAAGPAMVLSFRDMSVQRQLEAALQQASRMESLGRMAGGVAHDFNNMLSVITGGLELAMAEIPADSACRPDLDLVCAAAARGEALTRQLLTFARQRPSSSERFDVSDRLKSLQGVVAVAVGRTVLVHVTPCEQTLFIRADPSQFDQVIMNLAINARDAMPDGGRLTIRSVAGAAGAQVVVEDTGVGIPQANIDKIFEPFFTTKAEGRGTGLGLASAYAFAVHTAGTLTVESTEGVGTRFFLTVPLDA